MYDVYTIHMLGICGYSFENQMYNVYVLNHSLDAAHSPGSLSSVQDKTHTLDGKRRVYWPAHSLDSLVGYLGKVRESKFT